MRGRGPAGWWQAPAVRRRLLVTLAVVLAYLFVAHIPTPGLRISNSTIEGIDGGIWGMLAALAAFSGGGPATFSVLSIGVYAVIAGNLIVYLAAWIIPGLGARLEADLRRGGEGVKRWASAATTAFGLIAAFGLLGAWGGLGTSACPHLLDVGTGAQAGGWLNLLTAALAITAGAKFVEWLAQVISLHGVPNLGVPVLATAALLARLPAEIGLMWGAPLGNHWLNLGVFLLVTLVTIAAVIFLQGGQRRIGVAFPRHQAVRLPGQARLQTLPLPVVASSSEAVVAAQTLLVLPVFLMYPFLCTGVRGGTLVFNLFLRLIDPANPLMWLLLFALAAGLALLYAEANYLRHNVAEALRREGAFIPNVRPGTETERFLHGTLRRIAVPGALALGLLAALPFVADRLAGGGVFLFPVPGLLILVATVRDGMLALEAAALGTGWGLEGLLRRPPKV